MRFDDELNPGYEMSNVAVKCLDADGKEARVVVRKGTTLPRLVIEWLHLSPEWCDVMDKEAVITLLSRPLSMSAEKSPKHAVVEEEELEADFDEAFNFGVQTPHVTTPLL